LPVADCSLSLSLSLSLSVSRWLCLAYHTDNLIHNGDFENTIDATKKFQHWDAAPSRCKLQISSDSHRQFHDDTSNKYAALLGEGCEIAQWITFQQPNTQPLAVSGWSRALNVLGSQTAEYSLYIAFYRTIKAYGMCEVVSQ
jgi:hypothetical protein